MKEELLLVKRIATKLVIHPIRMDQGRLIEKIVLQISISNSHPGLPTSTIEHILVHIALNLEDLATRKHREGDSITLSAMDEELIVNILDSIIVVSVSAVGALPLKAVARVATISRA